MPPTIAAGAGKESRLTLSSLGAIASVAALSSFLALGRAPLFDLDEGAYAEVAREMLVRHVTLEVSSPAHVQLGLARPTRP